MIKRFLPALFALVALAPQAIAQDLTELSLEDLLVSEVSSVAKKRQKASEAPAAVYIISQEDIRRSGESTVAGLLRMAPGVEVAELDGNITAVTIRGFNSRFSNKLLVLVDGRSVYFPLIGGVLWDQFPFAVEDIERIEIVRGPGAAVWGANAVNGVINVITKHGVDTQGELVTVRGDSEGGVTAYARHGRQLGDNSTLRLYAKALQDPGLTNAIGDDINDGWTNMSAGFRYDLEPNDRDAFTLQGDVQSGEFDSTMLTGLNPVPVTRRDQQQQQLNILGRWTRRFDDAHQWALQTYIDSTERTEFDATFSQIVFDVDFSQSFRLWEGHEFVWGAGFRHNRDEVAGGPLVSFDPVEHDDSLLSGFVQDELKFFDDRLALTAGARVEHNEYTDFEVQPSVRGIWNDPAGWSAWAAVSRAVRTPARFERDAEVGFQFYAPMTINNPSPLPMQVLIQGADNLKSEVLIAYEIGWRREFSRRLSLDLAGFYNSYENALAYVPSAPVAVGTPFPTLLQLPLLTSNVAELNATGAEAVLEAVLSQRWRVELSGSALDLDTTVPGMATGVRTVSNDQLSPNWQASIRSAYDLSDTLELDVGLKRVTELGNTSVGDYTDLDIKLGWRPTASVEVYLRGENLLDDRRVEFDLPGYPTLPGYVERKFEAGLSVRF